MVTTPPMGWNSWDCFGASVRESEVRANAEYMAKHLKQFGWEYIVVDIQWYEPTADSNEYHDGAALVMDEYARLMPAENRFPSAAGGKGFRPLADYVHSLGLKFGIHILRGIPRQAVRQKTKIFGTDICAADIADTASVCEWNSDMYGVDASKDGARQYYQSLIDLYCAWGVDFLKVDDIARPYHKEEIALIRSVIDECGRDIVLSLSPGDTPLSEAEHLRAHADMWRMTDDFWDDWQQLKKMFDYCRDWSKHTGGGHWADADMLPLGKIGIRSRGGERMTNFTRDEQMTMLSLWTIFRSPMMFGGDMTKNDPDTLQLMQQKDIIHILKHSHGARELYRKSNQIVWVSSDDDGRTKYIAQFNAGEQSARVNTQLAEAQMKGAYDATELWTQQKICCTDVLSAQIAPHGTALWRLCPTKE